MKVAFKQVDVFTSAAFNGNPLAVIMECSGLSDKPAGGDCPLD